MRIRTPLLKQDPCLCKSVGTGLLFLGLLTLATAAFFAIVFGDGVWEAGNFNRYDYFQNRASGLTWSDSATGENHVTSAFGALNVWILGLATLASGALARCAGHRLHQPHAWWFTGCAALWFCFVALVYASCALQAFFQHSWSFRSITQSF